MASQQEDYSQHRHHYENLKFQLICIKATLRRLLRLALFQPWRWRRYEHIENVVNYLQDNNAPQSTRLKLTLP
jgi:hypothetical protein